VVRQVTCITALLFLSCIPQNEMVVLAGYMNEHVGSSNFAMMGCMMILSRKLGLQMAAGFWSLQTG